MQDPKYVRNAFARIADKYVVTNHVLSLGVDVLWRKKVGRIVAEKSPSMVLDLATGSGDLAEEIQGRIPDATVVGADFCVPMLDEARKRKIKHLVAADGMALPFADDSFDVVTVAFGLRNMADWPKGIREMSRVLKPGGMMLVLDFSLPIGLLRGPYRFYLHTLLPNVAGVITGQKDAYAYLGGTIEKFPSGKEMSDLIEANGFTDAKCDPLSFGVASIYTANAVGQELFCLNGNWNHEWTPIDTNDE